MDYKEYNIKASEVISYGRRPNYGFDYVIVRTQDAAKRVRKKVRGLKIETGPFKGLDKGVITKQGKGSRTEGYRIII